jgi:hypothetical protein
VIYTHFRLGDDNICLATVGVTLKSRKENISSMIPLWRFEASSIDRKSGAYNTASVRERQIEVIRNAVENMMSVPMKELKEKSGL